MNDTAFIRVFLYSVLFAFSAVLLGLTGYRIHYTETLKPPGDILTSSTGFYDPIIVELLVTSALAILFSLWFITAILARIGRGPMAKLFTECICLTILWIMFLVGAAIATSKWHHLRYCRSRKVCSILEAIKAFAWMTWILLFIILGIVLFHMADEGPRAPVHGGGENTGTYPDTRENPATATTGATTTSSTVRNQPVGQPVGQPAVQQVQQPSLA